MAKKIVEIENKNDERTPTLLEVQKEIFNALMSEVRVMLPAKVLRYDHKKQQADVQPYFRKQYRDGRTYDPPQIFNVPVLHLRTGSAYIHIPVKKNDNVTLIFADRELDKWLANGGLTTPADVRMHHITDAIAVPGLYPFNQSVDVDNPNDIIIKNNTLEMRIKPNDHFEIKNSKDEFVKVLSDMLECIRQAVIYTDNGPQRLRHKKFVEIQNRIKSFLEQ